MYIVTNYRVGDTVYFCQDACTVTRGKVAEIWVTQYATATNTAHLVQYTDRLGNPCEAMKHEDDLHSSASSAFFALDQAKQQPEPSTAEA